MTRFNFYTHNMKNTRDIGTKRPLQPQKKPLYQCKKKKKAKDWLPAQILELWRSRVLFSRANLWLELVGLGSETRMRSGDHLTIMNKQHISPSMSPSLTAGTYLKTSMPKL